MKNHLIKIYIAVCLSFAFIFCNCAVAEIIKKSDYKFLEKRLCKDEKGKDKKVNVYKDKYGNIYEGDFKGWFSNNVASGKGKLTYADGKEYVGEFKDGKPWNGNGKWEYRNGTYEGPFANNQFNGKGKYTCKNGDIYEGDFMDGKFHGEGKFTFADGKVYEGDFVKGKEHGKGKLTFADGGMFNGEFRLNEPFNGEGKWVYNDGDVYKGDFKNGNFNGKGKYTYEDGDVYEGEFKNGKYNGKGILREAIVVGRASSLTKLTISKNFVLLLLRCWRIHQVPI
jgi:hypothetical protein